MKDIRVLSLNVFCRPPGIRNNKDDYKDERLNLIASESCIGQFDVVAFQELFAFGSGRQSEVIEKAKALGFPFRSTSTPVGYFSGRLIDGGLAFLSRYPIEEKDEIVFSRGTGVDGWCAKGVLYIRIRINEGGEEDPTRLCLHIFTTHTQASYNTHQERKNPEINRANDTARNVQFQELGAFIAKKLLQTSEREGGGFDRFPTLLLGDLNVDGRVFHHIFEPPTLSPHSYDRDRDTKNRGKHSDAYLSMLKFIDTSCFNALTTISPSSPATGISSSFSSISSFSSAPSSTSFSLHWRDLLFETLKEHPVTVGDLRIEPDGTLTPLEVHLTSKPDLCLAKSLDYIFLLGSHPLSSPSSPSTSVSSSSDSSTSPVSSESLSFSPSPSASPSPSLSLSLHASPSPTTRNNNGKQKEKRKEEEEKKVLVEVLKDSVRVEPYFVTSHPFSQLTDHYGVAATLRLSFSE